ncbi:MAG TPA: NAD(P)H-dependent glycerol-3-phosphate dehydrogenase [Pyrinomonadaceae bacterium]|nr:NAD(P)H-dependent glycerol-3-phosphate dehydrogenase [Pyrinomonadaceae bacterium]
MRVAVIGAGSWGTALAIHASRAGNGVEIWARSDETVAAINRDHANPGYLRGVTVPKEVHATADLQSAAKDSQILILAAPSHATRELVSRLRNSLHAGLILVSATKGIETESGKRISQIVSDLVPTEAHPRFVCLSGPSFAREVVDKHPTAVVAASDDHDAARAVQTNLSFDNLRIYTNDDVVGTELAGSVKNVMAIAAGMVAGLGFGSNSVAALITRGLAEMTRLALRQGGRIETLMGLAGIGDLVLTCTGSLSRNRHVGYELGLGRSLESITSDMSEVAEGIKTALAVKNLADQLGIEMPITNEVHAVLYEKKTAREAANELMIRPLREEADK